MWMIYKRMLEPHWLDRANIIPTSTAGIVPDWRSSTNLVFALWGNNSSAGSEKEQLELSNLLQNYFLPFLGSNSGQFPRANPLCTPCVWVEPYSFSPIPLPDSHHDGPSPSFQIAVYTFSFIFSSLSPTSGFSLPSPESVLRVSNASMTSLAT